MDDATRRPMARDRSERCGDDSGSRPGGRDHQPGAEPTDTISGELTDRQRSMLQFERTWWQFDEPRDALIREHFDCSLEEYYSELNQLLELPRAMAHDPLVVRRFRRRRLRRRRSLLQIGPAGAPSAPELHQDDSPERQGGAQA